MRIAGARSAEQSVSHVHSSGNSLLINRKNRDGACYGMSPGSFMIYLLWLQTFCIIMNIGNDSSAVSCEKCGLYKEILQGT